MFVDLAKVWKIGKNLLLAEWGDVSWREEQMNTGGMCQSGLSLIT